MRIGLFGYFLKRALENLRLNPLLSLVTLSTISISLLILGLFALIYVNLQQLLHHWSDEVHVTAYLSETVTQEEARQIGAEVAGWAAVDTVVSVSKAQALARFRSQLGEYRGILEGLKENPLPASLELKLVPGSGRGEPLEELVARLGRLAGVSEVHYGKRWLARLRVFVDVVKLVGITVGGLLLLATVFVVSNTIKLTFYSRQDELEIMRLVGATDFFIKAPFLLEGVLHGLVGAALASGGLLLLMLLLFSHLDLPVRLAMQPGSLPTVPLVVGFLVVGMLLGVLGSTVSLRRFMRP
jgi:cell division transport system permease protein